MSTMSRVERHNGPLTSSPKWREDLISQLRLREVPGDRIGDILLEVEEHIRESGESPEEAFGPAKAYAERRSGAISNLPDSEDDTTNLISQIVIPGLGGFLLATGAFEIGSGGEPWGSLRPWLMFVVGASMLTWVFVHLPVDRITDPRSGSPLFRERRELTLILLCALLVAAALMYALGRIVS